MRTLLVYLALVFVLAFSTLATGCTPTAQRKLEQAGAAALVDCMAPEVKAISGIAKAVAGDLTGGELGWDVLDDAAVAMGARAGGCLLKHVIDVVPARPGFSGDAGRASALPNLRQRTGTSFTYRTADGDAEP